MNAFKWSLTLLAATTLIYDACAGEPVGATHAESGPSNQLKFIDPATGKARQPSAADIARLRSRAATMTNAPGLSMLPKTQADAARSMTVAKDGTETLLASQDSFSTLIQARQPDASFVIRHADAAAKEKAGE